MQEIYREFFAAMCALLSIKEEKYSQAAQNIPTSKAVKAMSFDIEI